MLLRWNAQGPLDDMERWRKLVIEGLQGTVNTCIR